MGDDDEEDGATGGARPGPAHGNPALAEPDPLATTAIDALDALNSAVSVGISLASYRDRVADAKIVVDRYLRVHPYARLKTDPPTPLSGTIAGAMLDHQEALLILDFGRRNQGFVPLYYQGKPMWDEALTVGRQSIDGGPVLGRVTSADALAAAYQARARARTSEARSLNE